MSREIDTLYICDKKKCGYVCPNSDCLHTFDVEHAANFEAAIDVDGNTIVYQEKVPEMIYYEFLANLECIAMNSGFRLCMERAELGCKILFYFRDSDSGLRSSEILFDNGRDDPEELFYRLKDLAGKFESKLNENKESFVEGTETNDERNESESGTETKKQG